MDELEIRKIFAATLKLVMDRNSMNPKDVERKTGVTSRMVSYILNIERAPTIDVIRKLSTGLRVPISDFFSSDDSFYKASIHFACSYHCLVGLVLNKLNNCSFIY